MTPVELAALVSTKLKEAQEIAVTLEAELLQYLIGLAIREADDVMSKILKQQQKMQ